MSRFNIKNSKWKIHHISTRHGRADLESAPKRSRTSATTFSTDRTNGTYRKYNNGDGGLAWKCSIAMRSSYHLPCSMMTERSPPKIRIFRAFYENMDEMLQEITWDYNGKYCKMFENERVTDVTNVTTIFRPKTQKRLFWIEGGFCRARHSCYDWSAWWAISPSITNAMQGIPISIGLHLLGKIRHRWKQNHGSGTKVQILPNRQIKKVPLERSDFLRMQENLRFLESSRR